MRSEFVLIVAVVAPQLTTATPAHQVHLDPKIIDGENASIADFLHYLQLQAYGRLAGGASIFNAHTAITSAFCVSGSPSDVKLRSWSDKLNSGGTLHQAVNIISHPVYASPGKEYDIALVIVDEPFDVKDAIPLVLSPPPAGALLNITGMGHTFIGGTWAPTLRNKTVKLIDHDECKRGYEHIEEIEITNNMLCAQVSAWLYDEGGPLEYQGQLVKTTLFNKQFIKDFK